MERNNCVLFVLFLLLLSPYHLYIRTVLGEIKNPNVVLIVANELGLDVLNNYQRYLNHISALSEEAIKFSHVYSQLYPTSSRAALLTGRLPVKTGMLKGRFLPFTSLPSIASSGGLPLDEETLAETLKQNGYLTKFIGLWDQGLGRNEKFLPLNQGFDSWFGIVTPHNEACSSIREKRYESHEEFVNEALTIILYGVCWSLFVVVSLWCLCFLKAKFISLSVILVVVFYATNIGSSYITVRSCVLYKDQHLIAQPYNMKNITLRFTDEALAFIKITAHKHPFFVMINHFALSKPLFSSRFFSNFSGKSDVLLDSLVELDWSVGNILETINQLNLTNDTVIIFTALSGEIYFHGKKSCNASLQDNKYHHHVNKFNGSCSIPNNWEKQIQVPLYIKWPKALKNGKTVDKTVTLMDVMPTILDLTNTSYFDDTMDGKSLLGLINGKMEIMESLHSYIFHYLDVTRPSAVTYNDYKAFFNTKTANGIVHYDPPLLFNLLADPEETSPLPTEDYNDIIGNISEAREKHVENRTRKWISQFEHPIFPWLFPCANFPYCHRRDVSRLKHVMFNDSIFSN